MLVPVHVLVLVLVVVIAVVNAVVVAVRVFKVNNCDSSLKVFIIITTCCSKD